MRQVAEAYLQRIHAVCPEPMVATVQHIEGGWVNDILIVNDHLVFRFPRSDRGINCLATELAVLQAARTTVPVPIPDPQYLSFEPGEVGQVFIGYPRIPGLPLWPDMVTSIADREAVRRLSRALMTFLRAVHAVPIQRVGGQRLSLACGFTVCDWRSGWWQLFDQLNASVAPQLDGNSRQMLTTQFEIFFRTLPDGVGNATVIHGDFATGNVLVDPQTHLLTGVIDFGSAGRGDPAYDVATLLVYGDRFVADGLAAYPEIVSALDRVRFYRRTFPLQDALAASERNDRATFDNSIATWKRLAAD